MSDRQITNEPHIIDTTPATTPSPVEAESKGKLSSQQVVKRPPGIDKSFIQKIVAAARSVVGWIGSSAKSAVAPSASNKKHQVNTKPGARAAPSATRAKELAQELGSAPDLLK